MIRELNSKVAIMDNRLGEMRIFQRVVEAGSYSAAARQLLMTPSTISKLVARVEERLGVRLLERSTRRLALTAEGHVFYERSLSLLSDLEDIEHDLGQGGKRPAGIVRVNASVGFGTLAIEPLLPAFWRAYPEIVVDLSLSDEIVDLYLDRTDVAFRIGRLPDSSLIAVQIGAARRMIVAAPAYLARVGTPQRIGDLARHNCLGFNFRRATQSWPVVEKGQAGEQPITGTLLSNNGETVRRMAVAGAGLARLAEFHVREDIRAGLLVEVLAAGRPADEELVHALHPGGLRMPRRVRAFLDFIIPLLRAYQAGDPDEAWANATHD